MINSNQITIFIQISTLIAPDHNSFGHGEGIDETGRVLLVHVLGDVSVVLWIYFEKTYVIDVVAYDFSLIDVKLT